MARSIVFIFLWLCFLPSAFSQGTATETLIKKLPGMKNDTNKLKVLEKIAETYRDDDPDKSIFYAKQALQLANALKNMKGMCISYGYIAESNATKGDFKTAVAFDNLEYEVAHHYKNKHYMAVANSNLGLVYEMQGDYINAQDHFFKCLQLAEDDKNTRLQEIASVNISVVELNQNNYDKTRWYALNALDIIKRIKDNTPLVAAKANEMMGSSYLAEKKNNELARKYYDKALDIYVAQKLDIGVATMYSLLMETYPRDYNKQLEYGTKAQAIWDKMAPNNLYAINNLGNIGITYGDMARQHVSAGEPLFSAANKSLIQRSEYYLMLALKRAKQTNSKQNIVELTDSLAAINALIGNFKDAYGNLRFHNQVADSLFSQDSKNKIASIEGKHEIELRDKQLLINKLELAGRRKQLYFLLSGLITLIIILALIYIQSTQRKKTNNALKQLNDQLDEANKTKTRFFNILNHDLRAPVSSFLNFLHLQQNAPDLVSDDLRAGYSTKMVESAEHLLNTMEDLLLWSKGQMENFKPQITQVKSSDLFVYVSHAFDRLPDIRLVFEGDDIVIETDEHYLKTIMHNLTSNAVKALINTEDALITWKAWEQGGVKYLSITDNGPGTDDENLKALYDDNVPIGIKNGLGLHIVRDLAKAIYCEIKVAARQGSGLCIAVIFK